MTVLELRQRLDDLADLHPSLDDLPVRVVEGVYPDSVDVELLPVLGNAVVITTDFVPDPEDWDEYFVRVTPQLGHA